MISRYFAELYFSLQANWLILETKWLLLIIILLNLSLSCSCSLSLSLHYFAHLFIISRLFTRPSDFPWPRPSLLLFPVRLFSSSTPNLSSLPISFRFLYPFIFFLPISSLIIHSLRYHRSLFNAHFIGEIVENKCWDYRRVWMCMFGCVCLNVYALLCVCMCN